MGADLHSASDAASLDAHVASLRGVAVLPESDVRALCAKCKEVLEKESNEQPVAAPVTLVGDVHGQFHDLLELFQIAGQVRIASLQETRQWGSAQGRRMTATRGTPTKPT